MLLDIDDGTEDGNERVLVFSPSVEEDRSFELVTGSDFLDEDFDRDVYLQRRGISSGAVAEHCGAIASSR